ncbi:MAG: anthranilate synthase component I family protein [Verrucomicrobiae bacterium]|nr:anthranilate synthase component I family protein [Verrucomicrobiae bacterium]
MQPIRKQVCARVTPEALVEQLKGEPVLALLRSALFDPVQGRYSFVAARPFLVFKSFGSRCEVKHAKPGSALVGRPETPYQVMLGNPWEILDRLLRRFTTDDTDAVELPAGGCFGFWGYDLKNFLEPKLPAPRADLTLPDCFLGFYDSLVVFDHLLDQTWIISTGLDPSGMRTRAQAERQLEFWETKLAAAAAAEPEAPPCQMPRFTPRIESNFSAHAFIDAVTRAKEYIRAGDIYQVNLAQRLAVPWPAGGFQLFKRLAAASPAPFAAYLRCDEFELASSSPELFLRIRRNRIRTRPIKGTRPMTGDAARDAVLARELLASTKERAELIMITDLLRNDLGKICTFGSVKVPELVRLEQFAQVQHLVATIEGQLRPGTTHLNALAACFPGGSITGAPKFRAMQIIDELEPVARGPYTGALGYIGFNRQSQLSIIIRTAVCCGSMAYFHVGAGIVADSVPEAEYEETMAKASGFLRALEISPQVNCNQGMRTAAAFADTI